MTVGIGFWLHSMTRTYLSRSIIEVPVFFFFFLKKKKKKKEKKKGDGGWRRTKGWCVMTVGIGFWLQPMTRTYLSRSIIDVPVEWFVFMNWFVFLLF
jgi:hypothetical protein